MEINKKTLKHIFFGVAGCILLIWLLNETERFKHTVDTIFAILSPFTAGACIAFILNVPMRSFEGMFKGIKHPGLRRTISLILAVIAFLLVFAGVIMLLVPELISTIKIVIPELEKFFTVTFPNWLNGFLDDNPELLRFATENSGYLADILKRVLSIVGGMLSNFLEGLLGAIGSIGSGLINGFISVVFAVYCLYQKELLSRQGRKVLYAFLPEKVSDYFVRVLRLSNATFSNFLSGQAIEVVILGSMFAITMAILGMPYIPLISVLIAITAFIPVVGAWVGCVFGAFLILVSNPVQALWFVVMFLILQQIENQLIYPRVVGTSIGLSGRWVLVAVSLGGSLMGVAGMFIMIPMVSVMYTLFAEWVNVRLSRLQIDPDKLRDHPPALSSKFKEKRQQKKAAKLKALKKKEKDQ